MKILLISLGILSMVITMQSCKGFLDIEPVSEATDENSWKTQDDANAAVAGIYALLRDALNYANGMAYYAYGDLPTDEFTQSNTYPFNDVLNVNWNLNVAASDLANPMYQLRRYDRFYRVIDQANRVIEYVGKMDGNLFDNSALHNYLLGEAYFMRAFTYFYMGRIWGGVPLLTEAVAPIYAENHEAAAAEVVLQQVMADLEQAKSLLGWENPAANDFSVRASKGAAFALEAHLHAWTANYEECAAAADSVIKSNLYFYVSRDSLAYRNIYRGRSAEGIFEITQSAEDEGTRYGIGDFTLVSPYHRLITTPKLTIIPSRVKQLFNDPEDRRLKFAFDTTLNSNFVICTKYANLTYSDETNNAIPIFKNNIVIFRLSDIKLLRAEALAATGMTEQATELLNEVRTQSGLAAWDGSGQLAKAIFDERARELFLEGHRYYDLVRLYKNFGIYEFPTSKMSRAEFDRGKYYWPFDPSLLNRNPLLSQNSYWATVSL